MLQIYLNQLVIISLNLLLCCQCVKQCYKGFDRYYENRFFVVRHHYHPSSMSYEEVVTGCSEFNLKLLELRSEEEADTLLEILEQMNRTIFTLEPKLDKQVLSWVGLKRENVTWEFLNGEKIDFNFTLWENQQSEDDVTEDDCVRAMICKASGDEPRRIRLEQHRCTDLYDSAPTVQNPVYICEGLGNNRPTYANCRSPMICPGGPTFICHDKPSDYPDCLPFHFSDLSVMLPCPYNQYGCECAWGCNLCLNKSTCDIYTGNCQTGMCPEGFLGDQCSDKACPVGTYAENCSLSCPCEKNTSCHWNTGDCLNAICPNRGFGGIDCDLGCNAGDGCRACHKVNHKTCNLCKPGYNLNDVGGCKKVILAQTKHTLCLVITFLLLVLLVLLAAGFAFLLIWINKQKEEMYGAPTVTSLESRSFMSSRHGASF